MTRLETLKLWRSRRPLIAAFGIGLFIALMLFGFYTYAMNETLGRAEFRYTFENESYFNGLTFAVYAFYFGTVMLMPVFAATEGGVQIAGETQTRTLTLLLGRPLSRTRIFTTKLLVGATFIFVTVGVLLAVSLASGLIAVGWGDLDLYPGVLQMASEHQHLSRDAALWRFAAAWPAAALALLAPLSLALLLSCFTRNAVNAIGLAVSIHLTLYVMSEIHFFRELRPLLYTSYTGYWRALFRETIDWALLWRDAAKLLAFTFLFLAIALAQFRRREET